MFSVFDYIAARPALAAVLSALALLDLSNCIRLAHADWPVPAITAFACAFMVREV